MARYRDALPQLGDEIFLTDGGIETTLIYHQGLDQPHFAAVAPLHPPAAWLAPCPSSTAAAALPFPTAGALEPPLISHQGIHLPYFAPFDLLNRPGGWMALCRYYEQYAHLAQQYELGLILDAPTWRASADWGTRLGYDAA